MPQMPGPSSPAAALPAATLVGRFLVAAPSMPDERFQKSVVFICKHDDEGALGIIVNNKVDDLPLGQIYKQLGMSAQRVRCDAAVGLVTEGQKGLKETAGAPAIGDVMIAGACAKVEHYEIASYRGLIEGAKQEKEE